MPRNRQDDEGRLMTRARRDLSWCKIPKGILHCKERNGEDDEKALLLRPTLAH